MSVWGVGITSWSLVIGIRYQCSANIGGDAAWVWGGMHTLHKAIRLCEWGEKKYPALSQQIIGQILHSGANRTYCVEQIDCERGSDDEKEGNSSISNQVTEIE
ncbi:hypothetical protein E2C01_051847 [Portunus trituberculatus]|uniref:Uncharacterized protein n=1 Tax=Portunus trituberculatus TaxID=210409 RepID=A0A5B7GLK0_PORTR|nr:hypothetical protein [Portunus trituberculatus]